MYPPGLHPLDIKPGIAEQLLDMVVGVGALQEHGLSERRGELRHGGTWSSVLT